jgi:hypothetical protein
MSPDDDITYTTVTNTTITGLTNGTAYTFTVVAINAGGNSLGTTSSAISPGSVPDAPTITSITRGNNTASVYFNAPDDVGGNDITGYYYSINGDVNENYTLTTDTVSPIIIDGLDNDVVYTVYLKAVNVIGNSIASNSIPMTTVTVPGAPTILSATKGDSTATISFTAPSSNGGNDITSYKYSIDDEDYITISSSSTSFTITGLTNGDEYTIYLRASNDIGNSSSVSTTVTPSDVPVAPEISLVPGDGQIILFIDTDYDDLLYNKGSSITSYEYSINGGTYTSTTQTSVTISGLENGTTYEFSVRAINANGTSIATTAESIPIAVEDI